LLSVGELLNAGEYLIDVLVTIPYKTYLLDLPAVLAFTPPVRRDDKGDILSASRCGPMRIAARREQDSGAGTAWAMLDVPAHKPQGERPKA